ncbi:MAG: PEP-CTERM sorting domain-containing protein [Candidatus Nealsonbacteria bacterium]|nr:PEP-CTERM sorting domain-containing protein [Candidatus Nealsonbacteria bacterium]
MWRATSIAVVFMGLALVLASAGQAETITYPLGDPPAEFMAQPGEIMILIRHDLRGDYVRETPGLGSPNDFGPIIQDVVPVQFVANGIAALNALTLVSPDNLLRYDTTHINPGPPAALEVNAFPFQTLVQELENKGGGTHNLTPSEAALVTFATVGVFPDADFLGDVYPQLFDTRMLLQASDDGTYTIMAEFADGEVIGQVPVRVVPIPEPGTIALLLTGLMGSLLIWRRRR